MYANGDRQPPIAMNSLKPILELARRYIVASVTEDCDLFLSRRRLDDDNFGKLYGLADEYHLPKSLARSRAYLVPRFRT